MTVAAAAAVVVVVVVVCCILRNISGAPVSATMQYVKTPRGAVGRGGGWGGAPLHIKHET